MKSHHRAFLAAVVLAAGLAARAQPALVDQLFERHVRVKSAAGPDVLHLLYQRKADPKAAPSSCYRRYAPGKGWLGEEILHGAHRCAAFFDGALYVFRRETYSILRAENWKAQYLFGHEDERGPGNEWRTRHWPLPWAPTAACRVGEELWLFGVEAPGAVSRIRAARLVRGSSADSAPLPTAMGKGLKITARVSNVSALARGGSAMAFWQQDGAGEGNELWHAWLDGGGWSAPARVPLPYEKSDYAAAGHEGAVWVFCKERGRRLKAELPLMATRLAGGQWGEPTAVPGAVDPRFGWTLDIDAASFDGTLYVFRACKNRVVAHRWSAGRWLEPETLFELSPWPTYLFWWLMANVLASLALLPLIAWAAIRTRARPRLVVPAFGSDVPAASWARRVAAQLVDLLLALLLCTAAAQWLGLGNGGQATEAENFLATVFLYSGIFFAYFVLSEGITSQSLGKWLLRIAVVGRDGRRPSIASIVVRNLFRPWPFLVPVAYLIGSLCLLITPTNQRLGDLVARTVVVDLPQPGGTAAE